MRIGAVFGARNGNARAALLARPRLRRFDELPADSFSTRGFARHQCADVRNRSWSVEHRQFGERHQTQLGAASVRSEENLTALAANPREPGGYINGFAWISKLAQMGSDYGGIAVAR